MKQKRIMILGGNIVQMEATLEARKLGYHAVSTDLHEDNPGHAVADEYCKVDIIDRDAVLREARRLGVNGIVPYSSDALAPVAAYVAEQMGLPGNPVAAVDTVINKSLFRQFLSDHGFASPWFGSFTSCKDAQEFYDSHTDESGSPAKAVIKPVDSAGSRGIFLIESGEDIARHWEESTGYSASKAVIIEQYIERSGYQTGGDIFIHDGKVIFLGLGNQHYHDVDHPLTPYALSFPCHQPEDVRKKIADEMQRLITALGLQSGPCNVELIVGKDGGIYFIDFGPRNGGCNIPYLENLATGFDENRFTVMEAAGDNLPEWQPEGIPQRYVMYCRPFIKESGTYKGLWISDSLRGHIVSVTPMMHEGQTVCLCGNGNDAAAFIFAQFESEDELMHVVENLSDYVRAEVSPSRE